MRRGEENNYEKIYKSKQKSNQDIRKKNPRSSHIQRSKRSMKRRH